ncbi:phospholipase D family protein [Cellvibrio sp. NN19]|uniref:phospholipase D family protein n=1 Tax=Cellvibrio chitinivorans TaxID=3102792 RepID=UPI002B411B70|nr:phospholipase D family protein [Cellvibrio sp. NN19]
MAIQFACPPQEQRIKKLFFTFTGGTNTTVLPLFIFLMLGLSGCQSLPERSSLNIEPDSPVIDQTFVAATTLAKTAQTLSQQNPEKSGFFVLADGIEALSARLHLIDAAEKVIDVQYYIWHDDSVGKVMQYRLLQAADRGVKVRLLLDDMDTAGKDDRLLALDQHPNIQIRTFNPFPNRNSRWKDFLTSGVRVNHRMHNKSITADRSASILGGRNIGDEYFNASTLVNFADVDVLTLGKAAEEVADSFDLYWNSENAYPLTAIAHAKDGSVETLESLADMYKTFLAAAGETPYSDSLKNAKFNSYTSFEQIPFHWSEWQLAYDLPSKMSTDSITSATHLAPQLAAIAKNATSSITIVSPYFVPGKDLTKHLTDLVSKGIHVRILTNSLASNDVALVHAGYLRYRKGLVKGGVELYELKPKTTQLINRPEGVSTLNTTPSGTSNGQEKKSPWYAGSKSSLHGKYFVFDNAEMFIGSFNLDGRSIELNTELGVYFVDRDYAKMLDDIFSKNAPRNAYKIQLSDKGKVEWHGIEDGKPVVHTAEPNTSTWTRFSTRLLSFIVPEKQL